MRKLPHSSPLAIAAVLALVPAPLLAQDAPTPQAPAQASEQASPTGLDDEDTIIVFGARLIGQVDAPQPPVLTLDSEEIAAYGAGSIAELLESLGSQVSSGRGRGGGGGPVILVNGVRIANFRELASYPPEAILRTEVFSEEVAQRYGFSPDQRVVNFILKDLFSSREIELEYGQPFDGGYSIQEVQATYLRIAGPSRLNLNFEWNNSSLLTEGERGVVQANGAPLLGSDPDPADYRSLVADSAGLEATGNWTTRLGTSGHSLSLNASFEREDSLRLQGLDTAVVTGLTANTLLRAFNEDDPLTVDRRTKTYALGSTLNLGLGEWQVVGTLDGSRADSTSVIARRADTTALVALVAAGQLAQDADFGALVADAGEDRADTTTDRTAALVTARGNPFYLPAGDVSLTLDTGFNWNRIQSADTRNPGVLTDLERGNATAGINIGIPLTSRDDDFLGALGDFSLNLAAGVDHLSDFGTLTDWTAGLTWGVTGKLTLSANYIARDAAPSLAQLGNPEIATPNVPVYDLAIGQTVLATVISGGNPALPAQTQSDWKFGLNWQLPFMDNASFQADYIRNHSEDVASGFPVVTPEIEAAFPGRVRRDGLGRISSVDERPVSFAAQDVERLQFGLNLSGRIGAAPQGGGRGGAGAGAGAGAAPQAAPAGGPPGGAFDPARMQAMRAQFCEADPAALLERMNRAVAAQAAGEAPPVDENGQPLALPPQMMQRLLGEDGRIDPARFTQLRERMCSGDGPPPGAPGAPQGGQQAGRQGGSPNPFAALGGAFPRPPGAGGPGGPGGPGGGGPGGGGGFRGPGGGGPGGGGDRWFIGLNYTLELENRVLISPGLAPLDLLDGDALSGGGQPRHAFNARAGVFYKGFGLISFANYAGATRLDGSGLPGSSDLAFSDLLRINLRAFIDLGRQASLVEDVPLLAGTRIALGVDNLFDARQRVTDQNGNVPLRYQPFLIDPVGRSFEIELRKLF